MSEVTIYGLTDPETSCIRYVGKTTWSLAHRLRTHRSHAKARPHTHNSRWINKLGSSGLSPGIKALEVVPEAEWEEAEQRWIGRYSNLTNATLGGEVGGWGWQPGEKAPAARLTERDVIQICKRYVAGGVTQQQLADEYGVVTDTVGAIVRGDNWRHVARPIVKREPGAPGVSRNKGNRHGAKDYAPCA